MKACTSIALQSLNNILSSRDKTVPTLQNIAFNTNKTPKVNLYIIFLYSTALSVTSQVRVVSMSGIQEPYGIRYGRPALTETKTISLF